eukprot:CAMPEP_0185903200 /NCGR_PEP_ID=MMETSP0196C-20130402/2409_1 /TAXON_ID=2932 /ORGANISM="Alexandrium fundyense, Strain CCMP1719" /LENGTH=61 /DNA_ID=CAMNT_0028622195 /DNA_START=52 /DNA_END=234 /DNA_ORIENTATION=-
MAPLPGLEDETSSRSSVSPWSADAQHPAPKVARPNNAPSPPSFSSAAENTGVDASKALLCR